MNLDFTQNPASQVLLTTRLGKYVWYPNLLLVDFIRPGRKTPIITLQIKEKNNTEVGATAVAMMHLLKELKIEEVVRQGKKED